MNPEDLNEGGAGDQKCGGDNPGEHTIIFGMLGETIELKVAASNRDCYAAGALEAAKFAVNRNPGLYNMYDVLGI